MLAFGIVAKAKPSLIFKIFATIPGIDKVPDALDLGSIINGSAVFMIVLGLIVTLVGFFGCFGACCENTCLLTSYIIVIGVVLCAEVALIIYAAVSPEKLKNTIQDVMKKSIDKVDQDINLNGTLHLPFNEVSLGWAILQLEAKCCGTYNFSDYSSWQHNVSIDGAVINTAIPLSCCKTNGDLDLKRNYNSSIFINADDCLKNQNSQYINDKNCYDAIYDLIKKSVTIAIGIAAGIVGAEVILIIVAVCLCRTVDKD